MGKATDFLIWQVHSQDTSELKPIKMFEKRDRDHIQGLPIFGYPLLSQDQVKLRTYILYAHL